MKESLSKQDIKLEWEERRTSGNSSPQVSRVPEEQTSASPRSVITTRRHMRTITTTGHITETIANQEPDSPESNSTNMQQVIQQQQMNVKNEGSDQQRYQEEIQHHPDHVPISPSGSPDQQQQHVGDQHHVIFAISNGQELPVEAAEATEAIKEPPR